jgi:hypothetical protein
LPTSPCYKFALGTTVGGMIRKSVKRFSERIMPEQTDMQGSSHG